ncbi:hypothetical protein E1A91_D09G121600v1 [Gossypium mustelinum]|uniref:RING-type domain-containing protein n=1 Tax=Gossypium mustelinum TaxID=34275 RepID=A0A5D2TI21_GOSMU|nr:hypothetical protein E1A91_D09G121600v1 [Gossypium mustelinum]
MDRVKQIASLEAETLNRLSNWGRYSTSDDPTRTGKVEFMRCDDMRTEVAMRRARETNRDLETTLMEVQLEVNIELAKLLSETIHPAFAGTNGVEIEEEDGHVCGICLQYMEKGEEARGMRVCGHMFHDYCIFEWVKRKPNCPLCRCPIHTNTKH